MMEMDISVKTDHFDGPFGLLLHLIQKEEMSIRDLEINGITQQYLDYLAKMQEINFDAAGDYLYMAATLVLLKSKHCVTEEEVQSLLGEDLQMDSPITSKAELIRRLEELQHFQKMGERLWQLPKRGEDIFCKPKVNRKSIVDNMLSPMDLQEIILSMMDLIQKERKKYKVVKRDRLSIREKLQFLKTLLRVGKQTSFFDIMKDESISEEDKKSRGNTVITFISLLEMARLRRIKLFQNESFSNIYVDVIKDLADFNVDVADGFEEADNTRPVEEVLAEEKQAEQSKQPQVFEEDNQKEDDETQTQEVPGIDNILSAKINDNPATDVVQ